MQAYEFLAKPENGTITIPNELRHIITTNVKVIILEITQNKEPGANATTRKSDLVLPPTIDTHGWKFDREEANER